MTSRFRCSLSVRDAQVPTGHCGRNSRIAALTASGLLMAALMTYAPASPAEASVLGLTMVTISGTVQVSANAHWGDSTQGGSTSYGYTLQITKLSAAVTSNGSSPPQFSFAADVTDSDPSNCGYDGWQGDGPISGLLLEDGGLTDFGSEQVIPISVVRSDPIPRIAR